ncbi:MAG TPA: LptF/LptG family permease [Gemmatimonadaceae bacterium]|nr:LptF/LptG family permease [Gemmatimonadaceae bacterium]
MKIVTRYVLREHLGPLVFALSALTSLLLLNFVAKKFGELVGKGLPWSVIVEFIGLSLPFTLAMTLPMAVLVATLHAFSRFAAENEITAFKASGVSMQLLVRPVIIGAAFLTLFMVWFNDQVLPRANHRLATLQGDIARVKPTLALNEQVINEVLRGQLYLRAARIDATTNKMRDVVIYDLSDPTRRRTIVADSGRLAFNTSGEDLILTLHSGSMNELTPEEPERLQRNFFTTDLLKVRGVAARLDRDDQRNTYRSDRELGVCELLARISISAGEREEAWARLRGAEGDGKRAEHPRPVPGGMGALYCRAIELFKGFGVKEAIAAVPAAQADATQADSQQAAAQQADSSQPAQDSIAAKKLADQNAAARETLLEGHRRELAMTQNAIDQYRVEIEKKFAIAFACIVFVLLGAPIALRFPRGGVGLTIGVSFAVFGIYYVGLLGGEALADRNLIDPAVAMWTTDVLLGIVGVYLTMRLGSEGSTSRGSETAEWMVRVRDRMRARFSRRKAA